MARAGLLPNWPVSLVPLLPPGTLSPNLARLVLLEQAMTLYQESVSQVRLNAMDPGSLTPTLNHVNALLPCLTGAGQPASCALLPPTGAPPLINVSTVRRIKSGTHLHNPACHAPLDLTTMESPRNV